MRHPSFPGGIHRFLTTGIALAMLGVSALACFSGEAKPRPNFLVIVADDLCWRDLGYEGNKDVKTPNLDKLRDESMQLRRMFNPATTCSPTRHAILTGLYPVRSGAFPNHTRVYDGTRSIFTHLKDAGYRVALQGKEHIGPAPSFPYEYIKGLEDLDSTKSFLTRDTTQPWFMVYASNDPHSPWNRGPVYDPGKLTLPPYLHDNTRTRNQLAKYYGEISQLDSQIGVLLKTLEESGQAKETIVLFVSEQGSSFPYGGKWSVYDNGIHASAILRWPGRVKPGSASEALMQYVDIAPTFIAAAGIDPTKVDVKCPDANGATGFDGQSFLPILTGESSSLRSHIFAQHTTEGTIGAQEAYPIRAVRDSRYKLIRNLAPENTYSVAGLHRTPLLQSWKNDAEIDPALAARVTWLSKRPAEELYDLEKDPYELNNIAADPELAEVKSSLQKQLEAWMKQQGDKGMATEKLAHTRQGKGKETDGDDEGELPKPRKKKK